MSLREAVDAAVAGREVPGPVLESAFGEIMAGKSSDALIAALLVALHVKGETVGEIVAAARALRAAAITVPGVDPRTLDTCGTGGDGAGTFNISTASAFVVAGAGVPVAKHGNRAASSRAGSIDVLEALGVRVDISIEASGAILSEIGIAPFFARRAHPAMANVAPVRRELGFRTLMNCLGPLVNPMGVRLQLVGVYADNLVEPLARALGDLGAARALVVHGSDGLDEITTSGRTHAALWADGEVRSFDIDPADYDIPPAVAGALRGGDAIQNAATIRAVLAGEPGACADVVLINAAAALWVGSAVPDISDGLVLARQSIESGAAGTRLEQLVAATQAVSE
jgi:anthranilate phosphoribosyltransferase